MENGYIYIDGEFYPKAEAKISVFDHGLLYGDGVFEGIRVYSNRVLELESHVDRLYDSAKTIMLNIPIDKKEMINVVINSCKKNSISDGYVRLIVTRGVGDLGIDPRKSEKPSIICIAADITLYPEELYENGMPIITASQRRNKASSLDPQIKSLNYLNNILAKIEAIRAGVNEALMLNEDGIVTECTGDNIFIVKNNEVITPPKHVGILCGITRNILIRIIKDQGISFSEQEFTLFNLYNADECFLTGTAAETIPVVTVDSRKIGNGTPGPITKSLLSQFRKYIRDHCCPK